jgi:hypothetical protein
MDSNRRVHERVVLKHPVTLVSPDQQKIRATLVNISMKGLLLTDSSHPIDKTSTYWIKLLSASGKAIHLSGNCLREDNGQVVLRITRYHLDSKELLESFITDLKTTNELFELLDDGWLDHLFETEEGQNIKVKYS